MNFYNNKYFKLLLNGILTALIIIISVQLILRDDVTRERLQMVESVFYTITDDTGEVMKVIEDGGIEKQGVIVFESVQPVNPAGVFVVINSEKVDNFEDGNVVVEVGRGDRIFIDARNYDYELEIEITDISSFINNFEVGDRLRTTGNRIFLGTVEINDKL